MFLQAVLVIYTLAFVGILLSQGLSVNSTPAESTLFILLALTGLYFLLLLLSRTPLRKFPGLSSLKALTFLTSLLSTTFLLVATLLSAQTQQEYLFAAAFAPLPLYFWTRSISLLHRKKAPAEANPAVKEGIQDKEIRGEPSLTAAVLDKIEGRTAEPDKEAAVSEPNRRVFLKRAGGIGLGLLAYSLLNPRQAGAAFFGSVPGPGTVAIKDSAGVVIDPAEKYPTSGYGITEIDEDGTTLYYGLVEKTGKWYILKESDTVGDLSYLYATTANNPSITDFDDAWDIHDTTLSYARFDSAF